MNPHADDCATLCLDKAGFVCDCGHQDIEDLRAVLAAQNARSKIQHKDECASVVYNKGACDCGSEPNQDDIGPHYQGSKKPVMAAVVAVTNNRSVDNLIGLMRAGKLDKYLSTIQQEAMDRQKCRVNANPIVAGQMFKIGAGVRPLGIVGVSVEIVETMRSRVKVRLLEEPTTACRFTKGSTFLINKSALEST